MPLEKTAILFVCTGNICRSPLAQAVFTRMLEERNLRGRFIVDSAGTSDFHDGAAADPRAVAVAARRGYDAGRLRARGLRREDFVNFNIIVAMTRKHLEEMQRVFGEGDDRLRLFPGGADGATVDVPDPYYGGEEGFEHALDLIETGCSRLFGELTSK